MQSASVVKRPLVCVSIEGHTVKECVKSAGLATLAGADILEIRFDFFYLTKILQENQESQEKVSKKKFELISKEVSEVDVAKIISELKESIEKPVVFTCRSKTEGGHFPGNETQRIEILSKAIESEVSWIDLEINIDSEDRKKLHESANNSNTQVIASYHDVLETPNSEKIISLVEENIDSGEIIKLCFKTNDHHDGIEIVNACWSLIDNPKKVSIMGLGPSGDWTRLHAPLLGQSMVYATLETDFHLGKKGLINVRDLTDAWDMLEY